MVSNELLRRYTLFSGLNHEQLTELCMISDIYEYQAEQVIFEAGESASHLCFVLEGKVDLLTEFPDGSQKAWMDVTSGFLLCWSSVIKPYRYSFSAQAAKPVQMLKIDGPKLRELMDKDHDLGYVLMTHIAHALAERVRATRTMLISLKV
jgi:CRP/FNR family transcriptional regulator, cyclic AMP receptor protein